MPYPMDLKDKKILITGGNGFLGRHILKNLLENRGVPSNNIFTPHLKELDLRDQKVAAKAVQKMDIVIHLASLSSSLASKTGPASVFYGNSIMGLNLLEASRMAGVKKFISIGSANEYPHNAPMPLKEEYLWQGMSGPELFPYSMSKKVMALGTELYRKEYGFNAIHLILASMYGPGYDPDSSMLVPAIIRQIQKAKKDNLPNIIGWGSGNATRDFLYVEDAAEGIIKAAELYNKEKPLNIGSGIETPVRELMETLCSALEFKDGIRWDETKPEGSLRYVLDVSRARRELGFNPLVDIKNGLTKTVKKLNGL